MLGLTVNNIYLARVLVPVAHYLDHCWWYLGGTGMSFPGIRLPRTIGDVESERTDVSRDARQRSPALEAPRFDPGDLQRYREETRAASAEYANWVDASRGYRVGKPGFFSRYAAGMDGGWQTYYVSDSAEQWPVSFGCMAKRFDTVWFEAPVDVPPDVCLVTRDVDSAYLDLFFRDEWMFSTVWGYAETKGMKPRDYRPLDVTGSRRG
jgi:hypothetical protein